MELEAITYQIYVHFIQNKQLKQTEMICKVHI